MGLVICLNKPLQAIPAQNPGWTTPDEVAIEFQFFAKELRLWRSHLTTVNICLLIRIWGLSQYVLGFPGSLAGKESAWKAGNLGSIPGLGRSPGEQDGNLLQKEMFPSTIFAHSFEENFIFIENQLRTLY